MLDKNVVQKDLDKLIDIRAEFLEYLDAHIAKKSNGMEFDFDSNPTLDAKDIYERFFKLDYQARKLRGYLVHELKLKAE